jgi:hypothetical protein
MSKLRLAPVAVLALVAVACEKAPLTAPNGSTIFLTANPPFVVSNGGRSVLTAIVTEPAGTFVPDGTEVFFVSTLGRVDTSGKTVRGAARVNFVADALSGRALVTALSGGGEGAGSCGAGDTSSATGTGCVTITVAVGSALPELVLVSASPQLLTGNRQATITANVFDGNGNPVQNVPVLFSVAPVGLAPLQEFLESGGAPRFTNSSGQAFDTLTTRAPAGIVQKTVEVTALTATNVDGSVLVVINYTPAS